MFNLSLIINSSLAGRSFLIDNWVCNELNPEEQINDIELRNNLKEVLKKLEGKEALIIQLYFVEELNIYEIAEVMEVSTGRVSQIKTSAIKRIREQLKKEI